MLEARVLRVFGRVDSYPRPSGQTPTNPATTVSSQVYQLYDMTLYNTITFEYLYNEITALADQQRIQICLLYPYHLFCFHYSKQQACTFSFNYFFNGIVCFSSLTRIITMANLHFTKGLFSLLHLFFLNLWNISIHHLYFCAMHLMYHTCHSCVI